MEFADHEQRPEQIDIQTDQGFSPKVSEENSAPLKNEVDYSKIPAGFKKGYNLWDLPTSPPERAKEQPDTAAPILIAGGLGGALPAPAPNPWQGAAEALVKGSAAVGRGAAGAGLGGLLVPLAGAAALIGGPLSRPAGGPEEEAWLRRKNERMRQQQVLQSSQRGRQGDAGDTGIRGEAQDLVDQGKAKNLEDALGQLMKEAKLPNGKADTKRQQRIKREQKARKVRGSRETKDIKDNPDPDKPKSNKKK
jgi:hypothetical protein